jgi:outer membrane protein TolC
MKRGNKRIGQLKSAEKVQELQVTMKKTDYLPMLYCGGSVGKFGIFNEIDAIEWQDDQKVFIGLSLTLFSGFQRHHAISQARAERNSFRITYREVVDNLEIAVHDAYEKVETNREQLRSARALVELAETGYSLSQEAYEVGMMTLLEMQQKEVDMKNARLAYNSAQFAFNSAVIDLKLLLGEL